MSWECRLRDAKSHVVVLDDGFVRLLHLLNWPISQLICGPSAEIYGLLMISRWHVSCRACDGRLVRVQYDSPHHTALQDL